MEAHPSKKKWRDLRRFMTDRRVLTEMHHLFWRGPFANEGERDEGWMCREHAFFTASLAALAGHRAHIHWGRLALIGPTADASTGLLRINKHSWATVEGCGMFDLSLNLAPGGSPSWLQWPSHCIAGSRFYPRVEVELRFYHSGEQQRWEEALYEERSSSFAALYFGENYDPLDIRLVEHAVDVINSPLTDDLRELAKFDSEIYGKGIRHVWEVANRRKRSLAHLDQMQSWEAIASEPGGANRWLIARLETDD
jgi:hypothetical protein